MQIHPTPNKNTSKQTIFHSIRLITIPTPSHLPPRIGTIKLQSTHAHRLQSSRHISTFLYTQSSALVILSYARTVRRPALINYSFVWPMAWVWEKENNAGRVLGLRSANRAFVTHGVVN